MSLRHSTRWSATAIADLLAWPLGDLIFRAQAVHRAHFLPNTVQLSTLASIKTGACPEDCAYCPQSVRFHTHVEPDKLMPVADVRALARRARAAGATRFCMGAAWRAPTDANLERVIERIKAVQTEGLETCVTLGMLSRRQAGRLAESGLDYYNHNLDTSPEYYARIITTRSYTDRLTTLANVADAGIKVCCGGILGMGETLADRAELLHQLATLDPQPASVPINNLIRVPGTPLADAEPVDPFDFVRTIAAARITMPEAYVRLSAGREEMRDETQALCFLAGANSIFYGETLLTTDNPSHQADVNLLHRLGMEPEAQYRVAPAANAESGDEPVNE